MAIPEKRQLFLSTGTRAAILYHVSAGFNDIHCTKVFMLLQIASCTKTKEENCKQADKWQVGRLVASYLAS